MRQRDDAPSGSVRHLTEGELHTFLDGQVTVFGAERATEIRAHLDACPNCRDRLAVESSVRDRATAILETEGASEPPALLSFAQLRERAARPAGVPERSSRRFERRARWGWAATVVLALGVGYGIGAWGPGAVGTRPAPEALPSPEAGASFEAGASPETGASPEAGASFEAGESSDAAAPARGPVESSPGEAGAAGPTPSSPSAAAGGGGAPRPASPSLVGAAPSRPATAELTAAERSVLQSSQADSSRRARAPLRSVEEEVPPAARVAELAPAEPAPLLEAAKVLAAADSAGRPGDSLSLRPGVAIERLDAVENSARPSGLRALAERVAAGSDSRLSSGATAAPPLILRSDPATAPPGLQTPAPVAGGGAEVVAERGQGSSEREAGVADVSLVLEGSTIDSLRWMEVWPGQQGLVSVQRTDSGLQVELRIAGPAVGDIGPVARPPAEREDAVEGWSRAIAPLGTGWVALDGPLTAEELAALLATIR